MCCLYREEGEEEGEQEEEEEEEGQIEMREKGIDNNNRRKMCSRMFSLGDSLLLSLGSFFSLLLLPLSSSPRSRFVDCFALLSSCS